MHLRKYIIWLGSFVFLLTLSCKKQLASAWLIQTDSTTITASEAGIIWNNLDSNKRTRFQSETNLIGAYLSYLSREIMIKQVLQEKDILNSPQIMHYKSCWLTSASARALTDSLTIDILTEITENDIMKYRQLLGKTIWYSSNSEHYGPVRLPDLPWEIAFRFDTINAGQSFQLNNTNYSLDSLVLTSTFLENDIDKNTVFIETNLARSRVARLIDKLEKSIDTGIKLDSINIQRYISNSNFLESSAVLVEWTSGVIIAEQLDVILSFYNSQQSDESYTFTELYDFLQNQINLLILETLFAAQYPSTYTNLIPQSENFAYEEAKHLLFKEIITNNIVITEQMLLDRYETQNNLPIVAETRVFNSVVTTSPNFFVIINGKLISTGQYTIDSVSGYQPTLAESSLHQSIPANAAQLPNQFSTILFEATDADSIWHGPLQLSNTDFIYYSLVSIIPEHFVSYEEIKESIRDNLLLHIEEQKEAEWIYELEDHCNLQINQEILNNLPENPALWSNL